jgi:glycosyltransferase involved in cell wall biosynthesis
MKVAFITSTMFSYSNGPANFAINLWKSLEKFNREHIYFQFFTEETPDLVVSEISKVSLKWSSRLGFVSMLGRPLDYDAAIREHHYDVRIWNFSLVASWTLLNKKNSDKTKDVVFVNDPFSAGFECFNWSRISIRYWAFRQFERYSCRKADIVVANSDVLKELLIKEYNLSTDKVKVLLKGIDFDEIKVKKHNYYIDTKSPIKVCFVKSNHVAGGLKLLCDSLSLLPYEFSVTVIGPRVIESYFYDYQKIKINLKGRQKKEEVYHTLAESDLFAVPFLLEAFGQINMEAFQVGVPTLILPTNYQMLLHDNSYAHIPLSTKVNDISESIESIIQMPAIKREQFAVHGRNAVSSKYDRSLMVDSMTKILQDL